MLPKHTALATISPIQNHDVIGYEKSTTEPTIPLVSYDTQLQALNDLGIEVDANHYNQSQKEKLVTVLYNNRDLFTDDICNLPGNDLVTHTIDTGDAPPFDNDHTVIPLKLGKNLTNRLNSYLTLISLRNQTAPGEAQWCW